MSLILIVFGLIAAAVLWDERQFESRRQGRFAREGKEREERAARIEGECPDCDGQGSVEGERCPTCRGKKWVTPSRYRYYYKPIDRPNWANKRKPADGKG